MRTFFACLAFALIPTLASAEDVFVEGYTRADGTEVRSHYRSAPDDSKTNNWSYPGNVNPHTGERAGGSSYGSSNDFGYGSSRKYGSDYGYK